MVEVQVEEVMRRIERMLGDAAPFDELMAAIDACAAMPGAAPTYITSLHRYRLIAMDIHQRPDDELRRALDEFIVLDMPLQHRAMSVIAACADRPALAATYLPPLMAELEAAIAATHDEPLIKTLDYAQKLCTRLGLAPKSSKP